MRAWGFPTSSTGWPRRRSVARTAPPEAYGHDELAAELADFCEWGREAARYLTEDGMILARVLLDSAGEYVSADEAGDAILRDVAIEEASQGEG